MTSESPVQLQRELSSDDVRAKAGSPSKTSTRSTEPAAAASEGESDSSFAIAATSGTESDNDTSEDEIRRGPRSAASLARECPRAHTARPKSAVSRLVLQTQLQPLALQAAGPPEITTCTTPIHSSPHAVSWQSGSAGKARARDPTKRGSKQRDRSSDNDDASQDGRAPGARNVKRPKADHDIEFPCLLCDGDLTGAGICFEKIKTGPKTFETRPKTFKNMSELFRHCEYMGHAWFCKICLSKFDTHEAYQDHRRNRQACRKPCLNADCENWNEREEDATFCGCNPNKRDWEKWVRAFETLLPGKMVPDLCLRERTKERARLRKEEQLKSRLTSAADSQEMIDPFERHVTIVPVALRVAAESYNELLLTWRASTSTLPNLHNTAGPLSASSAPSPAVAKTLVLSSPTGSNTNNLPQFPNTEEQLVEPYAFGDVHSEMAFNAMGMQFADPQHSQIRQLQAENAKLRAQLVAIHGAVLDVGDLCIHGPSAAYGVIGSAAIRQTMEEDTVPRMISSEARPGRSASPRDPGWA